MFVYNDDKGGDPAAAANDLLLHAIGGLLSNEMDPRHVTALVQLVNSSQRINQHAELEARLKKLEQAATGAGALRSQEDPQSTDASANALPAAGKPGTPHILLLARKIGKNRNNKR